MTEAEKYFKSIGESIGEGNLSQMFGKPCFKVNKKAYVCFFQDEMVFKLTGEDHYEAINLDGAHLFDPSGKGRAMKEWVQLSFMHQDKWQSFAEKAAEYVGSK